MTTDNPHCPICQSSVAQQVYDNRAVAALSETVWHEANRLTVVGEPFAASASAMNSRKRPRWDSTLNGQVESEELLERIKALRSECERAGELFIDAAESLLEDKKRMLQRMEASIASASASVEAAKAALDARLANCVQSVQACCATRVKALEAQINSLEISAHQIQDCAKVCAAALVSGEVSELSAAQECCAMMKQLVESSATAMPPSVCTYLKVSTLLQAIEEWAANNIWMDDGIHSRLDDLEDLPHCFLQPGCNRVPVTVVTATGKRVVVDHLHDVVVVKAPVTGDVNSVSLDAPCQNSSFDVLIELENRLVEQHELIVSVYGSLVRLPLASWLVGELTPKVHIDWRAGPFDMAVSEDGSLVALTSVSLSCFQVKLYSGITGALLATAVTSDSDEGGVFHEPVHTSFTTGNRLLAASGRAIVLFASDGVEVFRQPLTTSADHGVCGMTTVNSKVAIAWKSSNCVEVFHQLSQHGIVARFSSSSRFPILPSHAEDAVTITHLALSPDAQFVAVAFHTTAAAYPFSSSVVAYSVGGQRICSILQHPLTIFGITWTVSDQIVTGCMLLPSVSPTSFASSRPTSSSVCFVDSWRRVSLGHQDECRLSSLESEDSESDNALQAEAVDTKDFHDIVAEDRSRLPEFEIPLQLPLGCPSFSVTSCKEGVLIGMQSVGGIALKRLN